MHNATFIFPMNWRFFPTLDPQVDMYLSRDLDSEFNERELSGKLSNFLQTIKFSPLKPFNLQTLYLQY